MEQNTNISAEIAEDKPDGTTAAETSAETSAAEKPVKEKVKEYFSATRIAYIAIFTAISFVLRMLQFSVLPAVPYLQLDFSNTFILVCAYALGPVAGAVSLILKEMIYGLCFTSTAFVGELANIIITMPFILIPSIIYKKHKGIKSVILWLAVATVVQVLWSFPVNWLLNFPVFVGFKWELGMNTFLKVWYFAMLFNLIKAVALAITSFLLYKPLSKLIKLTSEKFEHGRKTA